MVGWSLQRTVLVVLLLIISSPSGSPAVFGVTTTTDIQLGFQNAVWGDGEYLAEPKPGDRQVPLTINLVFQDARARSYVLAGITGRITFDPDVFTNSTGGSSVEVAIPGSFAIGETIPFSMSLNINPFLRIGTYYVPMRVEGFVDTGSTTKEAEPADVTVPIKVLGSPELRHSILSDPGPQLPVTPGRGIAVVVVSNDGQATADSLRVESSSTELIVLSRPVVIDSIAPGGSALVPVDFYADPSLAGRVVRLQMGTTYRTAYGNTRTEFETLLLALAGQPSITVRSTEFHLEAGRTGDGSILVRNEGPQAAGSLKIKATVSPPFGIVGTSEWFVKKLLPGEDFVLSFRIFSPLSTQGSTGTVSLIAEFEQEEGGARLTSSHTAYFEVPESAQKPSSITAYVSPPWILAGKVNHLTLTVRNEGDESLSKLTIDISSTVPTQIMGGGTRISKSELRPMEEVRPEIDLIVPAGARDSAGVNLELTFTDSLGSVVTERRDLGLLITGRIVSPLRVEIQSTDVYIQTASPYSILVTNVGSSPVESLELDLSASPNVALLGSDGHLSATDIPPNGSVGMDLLLYAPQETVDQKGTLDLRISYVYETLPRSESRSIDFAIRGSVDLSLVEVAAAPSPVPLAGSFTISGSVFNGGTITANAVNVSLAPNPALFSADVLSAVLVGDLDEGSQAPFSLSGRTSTDIRPGAYPLTVIAGYKDDRGVWKSTATTATITVSAEGSEIGAPTPPAAIEFISLPNLALGLVIGVVVTALLARMRGRRRRGLEV